jgi:exonuclease 3'-5' domain-containing protein 2
MPRPSKSLRSNPEKRKAFITRFCVKNQAYSNCRILSASGALIAHCDRSKALWYLSRGLASHVSGSLKRGPVPASAPDCVEEEPLTVLLTFRPEERRDGSDFERLASPVPRRNRCVVCGTEQTLSRYHLVPRSYQKFFKVQYKAKQSTDIVLLCVDCHEVANRHVMALKLRIAAEYSAPLQGEGLVVPTRTERAVVKSASALLRGVDRVPSPRVAELQATCRAWWAAHAPAALARLDALDSAALQCAARLGREPPRKGGWQAAMAASGAFRPHGQIVVDRLHEDASDDAVQAFIMRWRAHFVHALAPRYMPDDWRMDYRRIPARKGGVRGEERGDASGEAATIRQPVSL